MTPDEVVEKALLYTFQLSDKDYRKMQTFRSETAFIEAIERDGYSLVPTADLDRLRPAPLDVERLWAVLAGCGAIENGTWVAFQHEDAVSIAEAYAALGDRAAEHRHVPAWPSTCTGCEHLAADLVARAPEWMRLGDRAAEGGR